MDSYFVPNFPAKYVTKLKTAGLHADPFSIGEVPGILLSGEEAAQALKVLKANIVFKTPTNLEGIYQLDLQIGKSKKQAKPNAKVTSTWDDQSSRTFRRITREILKPILGKDIILETGDGQYREPYSDENFHIIIFSCSESGHDRFNVVEDFWNLGEDLDEVRGFWPAEQSIPMYERQYGWPVAELVGNNLYILFDLLNRSINKKGAIYRRILKEAAAELTSLNSARDQRFFAEILAQKGKTSRAYVEACHHRKQSAETDLENEIEGLQAEVLELQRELVKKTRQLQLTRARLDILKNSGQDNSKEYAAEYERLLGMNHVLDVRVKSGWIEVYTDVLFCRDNRDGKLRRIGAFRIEIPIDDGDEINIFNLTNRLSDTHDCAPHVYADGNPCFGNIEEQISELLEKYDYGMLAMVIIEFLQTANTGDSMGTHLQYWPVVEEETKTAVA